MEAGSAATRSDRINPPEESGLPAFINAPGFH